MPLLLMSLFEKLPECTLSAHKLGHNQGFVIKPHDGDLGHSMEACNVMLPGEEEIPGRSCRP